MAHHAGEELDHRQAQVDHYPGLRRALAARRAGADGLVRHDAGDPTRRPGPLDYRTWLSKTLGFGLGDAARGHPEDELVERVVDRFDPDSIQPEEEKRSGESSTLVPVREGMVLRQMEEVAAAISGSVGWRNSPPKVACGVARADERSPASRIPGAPPNRRICSA